MKQHTFILILLALLYSLNGLAQTSLPKDYHNKTIKSKQRLTAAFFWTYLELNMPDSALNYVDSNYLANNPSIKAKVFLAAKTISPIYKSCAPKGDGVITYTDSTNIVCVYYTILPTPKFAMWLSFKQGDENSKILHIEFKNEKQLADDRKKWEKHSSDKPPKIPPPIYK
jgi:hypothetical protein